ncbi:threonine ammonia-lyase [Gemmatimonas sp.]|uniref:threonine ammonia-lyase n=1 Tax=Gemmatimonas sp. TaxID=1962908 RepID=UPI003DA2E639
MATLNPAILPAVSAVRDAAQRLRSFLPPSRLVRSHALSDAIGVEVWFKLELENPTGSFKVRGAYNVLAGLSDAERARGVVASSAGNHGLGVAYAAKAFKTPAMLYVPSNAPQVKKDGIRALGAIVNDEAPDYDAAMVVAKAHAAREGIRYINPCLGLDLLAGQGTVALEVLEQLPSVQTIMICTGGGGLLGGMGAVLRALAPTVRVVGVQTVETAAMSTSVQAGHVVDWPSTPTLADGLAGQIDDDALHIGQGVRRRAAGRLRRGTRRNDRVAAAHRRHGGRGRWRGHRGGAASRSSQGAVGATRGGRERTQHRSPATRYLVGAASGLIARTAGE